MIAMTKIKNPMTQAQCREWIAALRSGDYRQGAGALKTPVPETDYAFYCCLGVEREIHPGLNESYGNSYLREKNIGALGTYCRLPHATQKTLSLLNDGDNRPAKTFPQIADYIETYILPGLPA